jgi:branched-subunit amino acid ABC-type transport system permease component
MTIRSDHRSLAAVFEYTLYGKALRATAVNRLGARIVGIRTSLIRVRSRSCWPQ